MEVHRAAEALRGGDLDADAYQWGRAWWKIAMHWTLGLKFYTASPTLTEPRPAPGGASRWEFVDVAQYGEFPAEVKWNATLLSRDRPTPGTGRAVETGS